MFYNYIAHTLLFLQSNRREIATKSPIVYKREIKTERKVLQ